LHIYIQNVSFNTEKWEAIFIKDNLHGDRHSRRPEV